MHCDLGLTAQKTFIYILFSKHSVHFHCLKMTININKFIENFRGTLINSLNICMVKLIFTYNIYISIYL
jgi:hypothetical protein